MSSLIWTQEMIEYLLSLPRDMKRKHVAELINKKFDTNLQAKQVTKKLLWLHRDEKIKKTPKIFTDEQYKYFLKINEGKKSQEVTDLINKKFGTQFNRDQITHVRFSRGLLGKVDMRFKKGFIPKNKGVKGLYNVGGNRTSFKKGRESENKKPLMSERMQHNYRYIKLTEHNGNFKDWYPKNRYVWEQHYGEIPKGHRIIFLDGDTLNDDISNLAMVSNKEMMQINNKKYRYSNSELTKAGINLVRIKNKINSIENGG